MHASVCLIGGISDKKREVTFIVDVNGNEIIGGDKVRQYSHTSFKSVNNPTLVQRVIAHSGFITILDIPRITLSDALEIAKANLVGTVNKAPVRLKSRSTMRAKLANVKDPLDTGDGDCLGDQSEPQKCSVVSINSPLSSIVIDNSHYIGMVVTNTEQRSREGWIGRIVELNPNDVKAYAKIQWFLDGTGIHNVHSVRTYRKAAFAPVICSLENVKVVKKSQNIQAFDSSNYIDCNFYRKLVGLPILADVPEDTRYRGLKEGMEVVTCGRGHQNARQGIIQSLHYKLESQTDSYAIVGWYATNGTKEVIKTTKVVLSKFGVPIPPFANVLGVSGISHQPILPHSLFSVYEEVKKVMDNGDTETTITATDETFMERMDSHLEKIENADSMVINGNLVVNNPEMLEQPDFDLPDDHMPAESSAPLVKSTTEISLETGKPMTDHDHVTPKSATSKAVDKALEPTYTMAEALAKLEEMEEPITDCKVKTDKPVEYDQIMLQWDDGHTHEIYVGTPIEAEMKMKYLIEEDNYIGDIKRSGVNPLELVTIEMKPTITKKAYDMPKARYFATFVNNEFCTLIPPVFNNIAPVCNMVNTEVKELSEKVYSRYARGE
jgi:hypothetical protein